jgi:hypothetical protein
MFFYHCLQLGYPLLLRTQEDSETIYFTRHLPFVDGNLGYRSSADAMARQLQYRICSTFDRISWTQDLNLNLGSAKQMGPAKNSCKTIQS